MCDAGMEKVFGQFIPTRHLHRITPSLVGSNGVSVFSTNSTYLDDFSCDSHDMIKDR